MRTVATVLLLLLLSTSGFTKQPIGFKHWQLDDTTFSKQIGGAVRNYQNPDKTWDSIINAFEIEGDSVVFVEKSVLRAEINKNTGVSKVMLTWGSQEYTVTQKMLGIGWIKVSTRQSQWIDSTMNWNNFSVDSNICKWTGVSPGVDYRVLKDNGRVAHGIFYKPAFLDSAVTLYNQRPDSLDIALANVMVYTLSENIDDADSAMGELSWRRLKEFGDYRFKLTEQRLHFPGSDTLPQIPVKQYWERRGARIICIEYVMMKRVKQVHEAYPSATIWHNDTKKIEGTTNVEDTYISAANVDYNYGGNAYPLNISASYFILIRPKNISCELGPAATISNCVCSIYVYNYANEETYYSYRVFKPWVEGTQTGGTNEPGATWNDWNNDAWEWTTAGCGSANDGGSDNSGDGTGADRKATAESSTLVNADNTYFDFVVTSGLAQDWYDGTANENGILIWGDGSYNQAIATEHTSNQPFWVFTYEITSPHFGYCSGGDQYQTIENQRWANRSTPTSSGPLDAIQVWLNTTTASHNVHCAIYKWSDTSFVDSTEVINVGVGTGWTCFDFVGNDSIYADTEYVLVVQAEPTDGDCKVGYSSGGGSSAYDIFASYEAWPTPKWTTIFSTGSDRFSLCCFYTVPSEAAGQVIIIQQ